MRRLLLAALIAGCGAPAWQTTPHDEPFQRAPAPALHPPPPEREVSSWWEFFDHAFLEGPVRAARTGLGGGPPAGDVNAFGQVPDSAWFTNRIGRAPLTPDDIRRGPMQVDGPAPGPLTVTSGKSEGMTAGFVLKDAAGERWFVKFDPPALPGLSSGAEAIVTRLMWAAGWHVPENVVVRFDPARLRLAPDATRTDRYGRDQPADEVWLGALLAEVPRDADGQVRALFSRGLPGRPVGPWPFRGVRPEDPNDRLPHEHRRSLRGLWVFTAWTNDVDRREANNLDVWIEASPGQGSLRHYLIDFGTSMGAGGPRPKFIGEGDHHLIDFSVIGKSLLSLGFWYPDWEEMPPPAWRAAGVSFEADAFDPAGWRPTFPNAAFDEADARDTYWAASILARFSPALVGAAVDAAEYAEPGAALYVERVLLARREKLLRHAFAPVLPLDEPRVDGWSVSLTDLGALAGVGGGGPYRWTLARGGAEVAAGSAAAPVVDLGPHAAGDDPFLTLTWRRASGGPRVELHLRVVEGGLLPVGLWREVE